MYGTVARLKVKPGMEQKVQELNDRWWQERAPKIKGAISNTVYRLDSGNNEYILAAVFDSKENYRANADDPEQNEWFQEMAACLDGEPMWADGEIIAHNQK